MKVLVEIPSNEVFTFIEQIKNRTYQILDDRDISLTNNQIKLLDKRKDTPKNKFISREQLKESIRNRYAL